MKKAFWEGTGGGNEAFFFFFLQGQGHSEVNPPQCVITQCISYEGA